MPNDDELKDEVLKALQDQGYIDALGLLRRRLGVELQAASEILREIAEEAGVRSRLEIVDAELIGVGPYDPSISDCLDYPKRFYSKVKAGTPVITCIYESFSSDERRLLMEAIGVDLWNFATHEVDVSKVNRDRLSELLKEDRGEPKMFDRLHEAGFQFYFKPESPSEA